jgi:hypothetical protein
MPDTLEEIAEAIGSENLDKLEAIGMLVSRSPQILVGFSGGYPFHMYSKSIVVEGHAKLWQLLNGTPEELEAYLKETVDTWGSLGTLPWTHWTLLMTVALRRLNHPIQSAEDYMRVKGVIW